MRRPNARIISVESRAVKLTFPQGEEKGNPDWCYQMAGRGHDA
jgi:hypothetical protein